MSLVPAINQSSTDQAFLVLLTITPAEGVGLPLRVVNNLEAVTSRGQVFEAYPFAITLPSENADSQPSVTITIDAVDQRIIEQVRAFARPPSVRLELILSGSPDTVDKSIDFLELVNVTYDALTVRAVLQPINFLSRAAVADIYNGTEFPGLIW